MKKSDFNFLTGTVVFGYILNQHNDDVNILSVPSKFFYEKNKKCFMIIKIVSNRNLVDCYDCFDFSQNKIVNCCFAHDLEKYEKIDKNVILSIEKNKSKK